MTDKFIHHECVCARSADGDGSNGSYDVIEDNHGIYVNNANEGCKGRFDNVQEAIEFAWTLADAYDDKNALKEFQVSCEAVLDVIVIAKTPEEAIRKIRDRFHVTLPVDELAGHKLGDGVTIMGLKTSEYEAES